MGTGAWRIHHQRVTVIEANSLLHGDDAKQHGDFAGLLHRAENISIAEETRIDLMCLQHGCPNPPAWFMLNPLTGSYVGWSWCEQHRPGAGLTFDAEQHWCVENHDVSSGGTIARGHERGSWHCGNQRNSDDYCGNSWCNGHVGCAEEHMSLCTDRASGRGP